MARRKHQIGTLLFNAKMQELDMLEKKSQGQKTKAETVRPGGRRRASPLLHYLRVWCGDVWNSDLRSGLPRLGGIKEMLQGTEGSEETGLLAGT